MYMLLIESFLNINIINLILRNNFRWSLAAVMTRQNNIPLPEKNIKYIPHGDPVVYPTLVPGKLNKKK